MGPVTNEKFINGPKAERNRLKGGSEKPGGGRWVADNSLMDV